jgi:hypothetical protein
MSQFTIAAAFDANKGTKLNAKLFLLEDVFYDVRKGVVRFVKSKNQNQLTNRYKMTLEMIEQRHADSVAMVKPVAAIHNIRPIGKGGVKDFVAYARRMGVMKTAYNDLRALRDDDVSKSFCPLLSVTTTTLTQRKACQFQSLGGK